MHWLQSLLAQVSKLITEVLTPVYQVFIYRTAVLLQLRQFWDTIWGELAHKGLYIINIGNMRMRLLKLQDNNKEIKKSRSEGLSESWENIEKVLHYQDLVYVSKVICLELISRPHDNPLAGHFCIEKNRKLVARKYY